MRVIDYLGWVHRYKPRRHGHWCQDPLFEELIPMREGDGGSRRLSRPPGRDGTPQETDPRLAEGRA